ncbi:hypothetical protein ALP66_05741 [Pseudomonas amygdali pv. photiniae]|uniref:Uncharacterized protein n=1 Tax=Pseudomonas amygdali pv. photiniae TaxID=251724 RepID=A0A658K3W4_PSEA0|nr:hypothetical protein ALP66_05741 [Pseudomonas amygdali pv. photiniae]
MGDRADGVDLLGELVFGVHGQLLAGQQLAPEQTLGFDLAVGTALDESTLDRAAVRVIALEVQGVDNDFLDFALVPQRHNHPVVARCATAGGFPTVAHVHATAGVEDVAHAAVVLVRAGNRPATVECRHQIDLLVLADFRPVAMRHAVDPQARYAAVRVNIEAQVAERLIVGDLVVMMAVALQLHRRQHFGPGGVFIGFARGQKARFQRSGRRKVAGEKRGINVYTLDGASYTEADHCAVVSFETLAARLPAVHPLAVVVEHAFFPDRRGWLEQPVGICEPVIGDRKDFGAQTCVGQVHELLERCGVNFHALCLPSEYGYDCDAQSACRRNSAILLISARAQANSASGEWWMRCSNAARILCLSLPLTAMMNGKPKRAL